MSVNLLRYDLVKHGRVLATRAVGREVGRGVSTLLADSGGLLLSFYEVDVASPAFLSEVVTALRGVLISSEERWLLLTGMNEDVKESIELVLQREKMALGELDAGQIDLLGGSSQLHETLREAQKMGTFTAPDLAGRLKLKLPALHQRLNQLIEAGVLSREDDPTATRGKRGKYTAPTVSDVEDNDGQDTGEINAIVVGAH
jgi:DNA-binding MarR family transcriptional regulator